MAGRARTTAAQVAGDSLFFPVNTEDPARSPPLSVALRRGGRGRGAGGSLASPSAGRVLPGDHTGFAAVFSCW